MKSVTLFNAYISYYKYNNKTNIFNYKYDYRNAQWQRYINGFQKISLKLGTVICILTILVLILVLNILLESHILIYYITQIRPDDEIDFIELNFTWGGRVYVWEPNWGVRFVFLGGPGKTCTSVPCYQSRDDFQIFYSVMLTS